MIKTRQSTINGGIIDLNFDSTPYDQKVIAGQKKGITNCKICNPLIISLTFASYLWTLSTVARFGERRWSISESNR